MAELEKVQKKLEMSLDDLVSEQKRSGTFQNNRRKQKKGNGDRDRGGSQDRGKGKVSDAKTTKRRHSEDIEKRYGKSSRQEAPAAPPAAGAAPGSAPHHGAPPTGMLPHAAHPPGSYPPHGFFPGHPPAPWSPHVARPPLDMYGRPLYGPPQHFHSARPPHGGPPRSHPPAQTMMPYPTAYHMPAHVSTPQPAYHSAPPPQHHVATSPPVQQVHTPPPRGPPQQQIPPMATAAQTPPLQQHVPQHAPVAQLSPAPQHPAPVTYKQGFRIRLKNVPPELTANDIAEAFAAVSKQRIESVDVERNSHGQPSGEATVVFSTLADAQNAVSRYNGGDLNGRRLQVVLEGEFVRT